MRKGREGQKEEERGGERESKRKGREGGRNECREKEGEIEEE